MNPVVARLPSIGLILVLLWMAPAWGAVRIKDASGQWVRLSRTPQRIVSLAPFLTELVYDLGAGQRLVGTISHSDYPPAAQHVPVVGSYNRLNYERIVAARPDLVLLWLSGNGRDELQHLRRLGLTVYAVETTRLDGIGRSLKALGRLLGRDKTGQSLARQYRRRLQALTRRYQHRRRIRVFYQVWDQPLMTVGGPQLITHVLDRCGAENIFADQDRPALSVSEEAVIKRQPEAIIVGDSNAGTAPLARWRRLKSVPAVSGHHLIQLHTETLSRATPRVLDGMAQLCSAVEGVRQAIAAH